MTLKSDITSDLSTFMNSDEFADSATYTSTDHDEVSCNVIVDRDVVIQPDSFDVQVVETGTTITALYQDVGEPESGATFLIGSNTYTVKRITDNDRVLVTMVVTDDGDGWS